MARSRHPNKEIESALQYAEAKGWRILQAKRGHNWGRMYCHHAQRDGCKVGIHSTPRDPYRHANKLRAAVDHCPHP
jgi:hypothetical protein